METQAALRLAQEKGLDLIEVAPDIKPPVCRITDLGKYKYEQEKKARAAKQKQHQSEVKGIRITLRAARHDLEIRARKTDEFLNEGHKVRVEMMLRGRERANREFAKGKFREFLELITVPFRIDQDVKPGGRGLEMAIVKQ